jgi:hypothetical protein
MKQFNTAQGQVDAFEKALNKVLSQFTKSVNKSLLKLQTTNGVLDKTPFNLRYASAIIPQLEKALADAGYPDAVKLLQDGDSALIQAVRADARVPMQFAQTSKDVINALRDTQSLQFAQLGDTAMATIREEMIRSILTGSRIEDSLNAIKASVETRLQKYAWTYANTTRKDIMQAVNDESAKTYEGEVFWEYVGVDDDVTRPACQQLLAKQVFTAEERIQAEAETSEERAYNCRHVFIQIPKEDYEALK